MDVFGNVNPPQLGMKPHHSTPPARRSLSHIDTNTEQSNTERIRMDFVTLKYIDIIVAVMINVKLSLS